MAGKFVCIAVLLCVNQLALGDDLAQEKENTLKKIREYSKIVEDAYDKTCDFYNKRIVYLTTIKNQKMGLGQSLLELDVYEINQIAEGSKQRAKLLMTPQKVLDCIENKRQKAVSNVKTSFQNSFTKPVEDLRGKARNIEQDLTDQWHEEYYNALEVFDLQQGRALNEIKSTSSRAYQNAVFNHLERVAEDTVAQIGSLEGKMTQNEIQFDSTLEKGPLRAFKNYGRKTVDDFLQAANNCFLLI